LKEAVTTSVVAVPVAVSVCAEVHVALEMALVARALATLATVIVSVELAFGRVNVFSVDAGPENFVKPFAVPPFALGRIPVTFVVRSMVLFVISALTIWPNEVVAVEPETEAFMTPVAPTVPGRRKL